MTNQSSANQNQSNQTFKEAAMLILKQVKEECIEDKEKALEIVSRDESVAKVIEWYENVPPHHLPDSEIMVIHNVEALVNISFSEASEVQAMSIELKGDVDEFFLEHPVSLNKFQNLEYLQVKNAPQAPFCLAGLNYLKTLKFHFIYDLVALPQSLDTLSQLEHLFIEGANKITHIPEGIYSLTKLKTLVFSGLNKIKSIPDELGNLRALTTLEISTCGIDIPDSIQELSSFQDLRISNYWAYTPYQAIYQLKQLTTLGINIDESSQFEGIANLSNLKVLEVSGKNSQEALGELPQLEGLILNQYNAPHYPEVLGRLKKLKALKIGSNYELVNAPDFIPELLHLKYLEIRGCDKLESFSSSYQKMKGLELIEIFYNKLVTEIPPHLKHLQEVIRLKTR